MFDAYDSNKDGAIDTAEFGSLLNDIGRATGVENITSMSEEDIIAALNELDKDHNGTIEWSEFRDWICGSM